MKHFITVTSSNGRLFGSEFYLSIEMGEHIVHALRCSSKEVFNSPIDAMQEILNILREDVKENTDIQQPIFWALKDFADGWIKFDKESEAKEYQQETECLMKPIYVLSEFLALNKDLDYEH